MAETAKLIVHGGAGVAATLMMRKLLALKGLAYGIGAPTGLGGPGPETAWLQWGRRIFAGPVLAAVAIEAAAATPTLFPNGNQGMPLALLLWSAAAAPRALANADSRRAHSALIARQLVDGRAFLQGPHAGLADAAAWGLLAASGGDSGLKEVPLADWYRRIDGLGLGASHRCAIPVCAALPADAEADSVDLGALALCSAIDDPALGAIRLESPLL